MCGVRILNVLVLKKTFKYIKRNEGVFMFVLKKITECKSGSRFYILYFL